MKRMHRAAGFAVAIGVGLTAAEAQASSVTVTFGDLPNAVRIQSYYNGGLSGPPIRGPGPDLGLASVFTTGGQFAESAVFAGPSTVLNAEFDRLTFATPEPQTWAMLLIGFAGLGLLRRKSLRGFAARLSRT